jgi:hypothetical protein
VPQPDTGVAVETGVRSRLAMPSRGGIFIVCNKKAQYDLAMLLSQDRVIRMGC